MKQDYTTDVLICGAGAAGLTLAIDLARHGVAFRLIDKATQPFNGSRGKGIPAVIEQLARPGIHIHRFGVSGDLSDEDNHFMKAYGMEKGEAAMVRPDGYLAAVFSCSNLSAVNAVKGLMALAGLTSGASRHE